MKFSKLTFLSVLILLFAFISSVGLQAKETDMFKTDEDIKQKDPELCAKLMEKIKEDNVQAANANLLNQIPAVQQAKQTFSHTEKIDEDILPVEVTEETNNVSGPSEDDYNL